MYQRGTEKNKTKEKEVNKMKKNVNTQNTMSYSEFMAELEKVMKMVKKMERQESIRIYPIGMLKKKKQATIYKGKEEFMLHCKEFGLRTRDFGKDFKDKKIVGFAKTARGNHFILMGINGGLYYCKAE